MMLHQSLNRSTEQFHNIELEPFHTDGPTEYR